MKNRIRKLRDVYVSNDLWKWLADREKVTIFSPQKSRHVVSMNNFIDAIPNFMHATSWADPHGELSVTPGKIKYFIDKFILNEKE